MVRSRYDRIVLATVLGWTVIVQKDFKVGDKIVFAEIDSVFPEKPEFEFLRSKKFRIKTMKMGGVISQGIVFPLSILPKGKYKLGDDVTDIIGITQYEPTMDKEDAEECSASAAKNYPKFLMKMAWFRKRVLSEKEDKGFPDFINKTDEIRIQNAPYYLNLNCKWIANLIYPDGRVGSVEAKKIVNESGLKFVPIISEDAQIKGMTVPEVLEYATGKSQLYDTLREGIVFRSEDGKQSFKAVSPEYLLKNNE